MSDQTTRNAGDNIRRPGGPISSDARAMMMFEANKKSLAVAYLLWFFLGLFGGHRFYGGKTGSAVAQLLMAITGFLLIAVHIGWLLIAPLFIWVVVDAFLIPGWIRNHNSMLAVRLAGG